MLYIRVLNEKNVLMRINIIKQSKKFDQITPSNFWNNSLYLY